MNKCLLFTLLAFLYINLPAFAQTEEDRVLQQIREQEQARKARLLQTMDMGVDSMNMGKHEAAERLFKEVLRKSKIVPTDLCFYFGKNSYYLEKHQQSIDWLNKYLEIKGTTGRYSDECAALLDKASQAYLKVRKSERSEARNVMTANYEINCGPTGKVICPVCKGQRVIIEPGYFGNTYRSCPYSDEHGFLTCEEYNQLLRGELESKNN